MQLLFCSLPELLHAKHCPDVEKGPLIRHCHVSICDNLLTWQEKSMQGNSAFALVIFCTFKESVSPRMSYIILTTVAVLDHLGKPPQEQDCRSWSCQHPDRWQLYCVCVLGCWVSLQHLSISVFSQRTCLVFVKSCILAWGDSHIFHTNR